jgi:hypothetical protein
MPHKCINVKIEAEPWYPNLLLTEAEGILTSMVLTLNGCEIEPFQVAIHGPTIFTKQGTLFETFDTTYPEPGSSMGWSGQYKLSKTDMIVLHTSQHTPIHCYFEFDDCKKEPKEPVVAEPYSPFPRDFTVKEDLKLWKLTRKYRKINWEKVYHKFYKNVERIEDRKFTVSHMETKLAEIEYSAFRMYMTDIEHEE